MAGEDGKVTRTRGHTPPGRRTTLVSPDARCGGASATRSVKGGTSQSVTVTSSVGEIVLDLRRPRLIKVVGIGSGNRRGEWHLKVTRKGGLTLV